MGMRQFVYIVLVNVHTCIHVLVQQAKQKYVQEVTILAGKESAWNGDVNV